MNNAEAGIAPVKNPFASIWSRHSATLQPVLVFVVIVVAAAVLSNGAFATPANLRNLLFQGAILGVCALGQYIVVITGGIDLSVGTTISLSSVIFVSSMGLGVVPAVALALAGGLVVGLLNGALVAFLRLPPFVVTLAVSQIAFSAAQIITDGAAIDRAPDGTPIPEGVTQFGSALFLGLPVTSYVWVLAIGLVVFYLRTRSGRFLFPVGGQ